MLLRDQILKLDILTVDAVRILSATNRQFSLREMEGGINNGDTMMILKGNKLPEIDRGAGLEVIASMKNGQRVKFPSYVSVSTEYQLNVVIRTDQGAVLEERRRYYKIDVDISCVINCVERNESRNILTKPYLTKIRDLNIGGIFLCICAEPLEMGDKLMLTLDLGDRTVDLDAVILRVQKNAAGDPVGYGCQFVNVTAAEEDIISKYVFELQKERLQKEAEDRI